MEIGGFEVVSKNCLMKRFARNELLRNVGEWAELGKFFLVIYQFSRVHKVVYNKDFSEYRMPLTI